MTKFISKRDGSTVYVHEQTTQGGRCGRFEGVTYFSRTPDAPKETWSVFVNSAFRARFVEAANG